MVEKYPRLTLPPYEMPPSLQNIPWREPVTLAAGESLIFNRHLDDFDGSQGWALTYNLRGGSQAITFSSTPLIAGSSDYQINVPAATTAGWLPGDYLLSGLAINATNANETHEFCLVAFTLTPNEAALPGDAPQTTHYQRVLAMLEAVIEGKANHDILESKIEGTVIGRIPPKDIQAWRDRYFRYRQNEIDGQRAKSGLKSRNKIRPRFNITQPGAIATSQFGNGPAFFLGNK